MPSYAIARIAKLKKSNLSGSGAHTLRERDTPNANPEKQNIRVIDPEPHKSLSELVLDKISRHPQKRKIRSDAVYCVEFVLSASPEYFRPNNPNEGGYSLQNRVEPWIDASKNWLLKRYGDSIVLGIVHGDEMSHHFHAYFVPLDKDGQLRCKHFFGSRQKLQDFQDSYWNAVKHLGLERGIKGSLSKHIDIKDFYRTVEEGKDLEITSLNQTQIANKAADRDRAVQKKLEMEATAQRLALENQALQQQLQNLLIQNRQLHERLKKQEQKNKDLPLDSVAWHLGFIEDNQRWQRHGSIITINDSGFCDLTSNNKNGSSAIELVMHANNCKLDSALAWLGDQFGEEGMVRSLSANTNQLSQIVAQTSSFKPFSPPQPVLSNWQLVRDYLIKQQRLDRKIVTALYTKGWLYASRQSNAVFIMRQMPTNTDSNSTCTEKVTGAILYNIKAKQSPYFEYAQGTKRSQGLFYFNFGGQPDHEIKKVFLCKTPVDALSWATSQMQVQKPKFRIMYLVVDSLLSLPLIFLRNMPKLIANYGNDKAGVELAQNIKKMLPQTDIIKPVSKQKSHMQTDDLEL